VSKSELYLISGFLREVDEICALLGYYAAYGGNSLPMFRYTLSVPPFKGPIVYPETSVRNYHHTPRNIPEERRSQGQNCSRQSGAVVNFQRLSRLYVYIAACNFVSLVLIGVTSRRSGSSSMPCHLATFTITRT